LSADGSLLFQPSTNGIDVFDGRLGILRSRISLPFSLSQSYGALVANGKDNVLIAITGSTGTGIAVVDLSSIAGPAPLPYLEPGLVTTSIQEPTGSSSAAAPAHSKSVGRHLMPKSRVPHITKGILFSTAAARGTQTAP